MTPPASSQKPKSSWGWTVDLPVPNQPTTINPGNTINVQVTDNQSGNNGYIAACYDPSSGQVPASTVPPCTPLNSSDGGGTYKGQVPVQIPPTNQMTIVYPQPNPFGPQKIVTILQAGSSGSSGSHGCNLETAAAARSAVFASKQPVPAAFSAQFGDPQVETVVLIYSGAPGFERCWFSEPVDRLSDDADPALWMLERADALTWLLRLRRGDRHLVHYRYTAVAETDDAWPVQL